MYSHTMKQIKVSPEINTKIRIGVLMGGQSIEHEVSFNSGRTVCDHLDTFLYTVVPIFQTCTGILYLLPWHFLHRGKTTDFVHRLPTEAQQITWDTLSDYVDFMYIATHGRYAEDGTMQGCLEIMKIPYLGSGIHASALGMNKEQQKNVLSINKIAVAKFCVVHPELLNNKTTLINTVQRELQEKNITFPIVVKPCNEGSSMGVWVVESVDTLYDAIQKAHRVDPRINQPVILEEKIEGMEFSCIVINDYTRNTYQALPPTEIVPIAGSQFFDYEQKYMPGRSIKFTPPRCSQETVKKIQDACIQVMKAMEFRTIGRIDGFVTKNNDVVIIDPNSLCGMDPASFLFRAAAEIQLNHTQVINYLIDIELRGHGIKKEESMHVDTNHHSSAKNIEKKMRVAILMGGKSDEREISLESGRNITYKLSPHNYQSIPIFVSSEMKLYPISQSLLVRSSTAEIESLLDDTQPLAWSNLPHIADFVFIALHGGLGENGGVQGMLEMLHLPYNGSGVLASALCMDKYKTTQLLLHKGFCVPNNTFITPDEWRTQKNTILDNISQQYSFPIIIKPHNDGCSTLVCKVMNIQEAEASLNAIFSAQKPGALIEEFIYGTELTVGVFGNHNPRALPPSQSIATAGILSIEEKFLPGAGENLTPAPLPAETLHFVQTTIEDVFKAVNCKGYARIDCFYQNHLESPTGKERVVIIEINSLPGLTPATCIFHQAAEIGMRPMDFIDTIIQLGLQEFASKRNTVVSNQYPQKSEIQSS